MMRIKLYFLIKKVQNGLIELYTKSIQKHKQGMGINSRQFHQCLCQLRMQVQVPTDPKLFSLPIRTKGSHNKNFKKVELISNHYFVQLSKMEKIVIFSVKFVPQIAYDNSRLRNDLLKKGLGQISKIIRNPVMSGMNIYSLADPLVTQFQVKVEQYDINIKQVKIYDVQQNPKLLLTFLNNGLRNIMGKLNYVEIGRTGKYFNAKDKTTIDNLMMYNGYKSNFVLLENGYYLRVDSAKKIVRNQTVLQYIDHLYNIHKSKEKQQKRNILKNELMNKIVMTNYGKTRYFKIIDLDFQDLQMKFIDEQKTVSLKNYYLDKYKIEIKNNKQPLLEVEDKKQKPGQQHKTLLLPQLCLMTGIPDDFDQFRRKKISESTIKNPPEKMKEIQKLMTQLKETQGFATLRQIGIKIERHLSSISAKLIPTPVLQLGGKHQVENGKQAFFNLFNKPVYQAKHDIKCGLIHFKGANTQYLLSVFNSTATNLGVKLETTTFDAGDASNRQSVITIQTLMDKAADRDYNICLILIPNSMKNDYKKIKVHSLGKNMITQVMTQAKLQNKNAQSIITKVLLQMIAKRGNTLWVPKATCSLDNAMLSAFDSAKLNNATVLSVCATQNSTFSSVFSKVEIFDTPNDNKFKHMVAMMCSAIDAYVKRNERPPKQIFAFLNSCSGDQMSIYNELFIQPVIARIAQIYIGHSISLTVIMSNGRTSERFFQNSGQIRNVPAGSLISEGLVSEFYDFYLISQHSTRGSTVPNHYKVIYTDSKIQEGVLQQVIFSQCFNYVNWTGSIKVPAILQYAKKCAKFHAEVLEKNKIGESLNNKLYFI